MASGSTFKYTIPSFNGEDFERWSTLIERQLYEEGLLFIVEDEFDETELENEEIRQNRMHDLSAKTLILEHLSENLRMKFSNAKRSKDIWDKLNRKYNPKGKMKERLNIRFKGGKLQFVSPRQKQRPMIEKDAPINDDEGRNAPLSEEKQVFDLILTKKELKPLYKLEFPNDIGENLPSTNIKAKLSCCRQTYEIMFFGMGKTKWLGYRWRTFAEEHDLNIGECLEFEILKSTNFELHLFVNIVRGEGDPPLQRVELATEKRKNRRVAYCIYSEESD